MAASLTEGRSRLVKAVAFYFGEVIGRISRHFFLFIVLFGGVAMAIAGGFGTTYGVPYLFREDPVVEGYSIRALFASAAFWSQLTATLLAGAVWLFGVTLSYQESNRLERMSVGRELLFYAIRIIPTSFIALLALAMPLSPDVPRLGEGEIGRALIGMLLGLVANGAIVVLSRLLAHPASFVASFVRGLFPGLQVAEEGAITPEEQERRSKGDRIGWRAFVRKYVHFVMFIAMIAFILMQPRLIPATVMFLIASILLAIYVFFNFFPETWRALLFFAVLLFIGLFAGTKYKYKFPGMEDYYKDPVTFEAGSRLRTQKVEWEAYVEKVAPAEVSKATEFSAESSRRKRGFDQPQPNNKPKFVVVTTSGGAYTATFFTAMVLDLLREQSLSNGQLPGLDQNIRLMTGASGGLVGAAYFAVLPRHFPNGADNLKLVDLITNDIAASNKGGENNPLGFATRAPRDSLTAVAQQLAKGDIFDIVTPIQRDRDRGLALEQQWRMLDVTFAELKPLEAEGRTPSMIFSPMLVETGQPMFISNLDLSGLPKQEIGETLNFFETFPKSYQTFTLATAARMSSTFPFVSPAVDLPTEPIRRVVDAGYFDNFGINMAVTYLRQPKIIELIRELTSGVIIIQINAYPIDQTIDTGIEADCQSKTAPIATKDQQGFEFLLSPLEGLFAARNASMVFRNEQELGGLRDLYAEKGIQLNRVTFENKARSSFSWYLPDRDLRCMQAQLKAEHNLREMRRLVRLWEFRGANRPAE